MALAGGKDSRPAALGSAEEFGLTQREELAALGYPVGVTSYHCTHVPLRLGIVSSAAWGQRGLFRRRENSSSQECELLKTS